MKPKVYIETSVISYLTARLSRDLIVASHQQITHEWWEIRKPDFELYVSQLVISEASRGDEIASQRRLSVLHHMPLLQFNDNVANFAQNIVSEKVIPERYAEDAIHVAVATIHKMDFLMTWNCAHIANAEIRRKLMKLCIFHGYEMPTICTPEELMGDK